MRKKNRKTTPEEWIKWGENQRRLERIIERRLKEDATRAEAAARVGERPS